VPPALVDRTPSIRLLENRHDLGFRERRLPHENLLARVISLPESSPCELSQFTESLYFVWTKTADEILASVARFCHQTSDSGL
jgi:hypothetical protein